jgi:thymidylate synthase
MYLGVPYNFANLAYLTHAMAHATEKQPGVIHWTGVDCHVYANHHDEVDTAISQYDPNDERHPRLRLDTGFSVLYPDMEHVMLEDYFPGPPVPAPVAV